MSTAPLTLRQEIRAKRARMAVARVMRDLEGVTLKTPTGNVTFTALPRFTLDLAALDETAPIISKVQS